MCPQICSLIGMLALLNGGLATDDLTRGIHPLTTKNYCSLRIFYKNEHAQTGSKDPIGTSGIDFGPSKVRVTSAAAEQLR